MRNRLKVFNRRVALGQFAIGIAFFGADVNVHMLGARTADADDDVAIFCTRLQRCAICCAIGYGSRVSATARTA